MRPPSSTHPSPFVPLPSVCFETPNAGAKENKRNKLENEKRKEIQSFRQDPQVLTLALPFPFRPFGMHSLTAFRRCSSQRLKRLKAVKKDQVMKCRRKLKSKYTCTFHSTVVTLLPQVQGRVRGAEAHQTKGGGRGLIPLPTLSSLSLSCFYR